MELTCEFAGQQQFDEKNIRRRVYDALNVLMAMGIILKDKKDIQWKGLPCASVSDVQSLKVSFHLCSSMPCSFAGLECHCSYKGLAGITKRHRKWIVVHSFASIGEHICTLSSYLLLHPD